ncbi:MAG: NADH-quinone oxidoreductase subunit M [Pirellulales bacterium]
MNSPLSLTILVPLVGAMAVAMVAPAGRGAVRLIALGSSLLTLALAAVVVVQFPAQTGHYEADWFGLADAGIDVRLAVGLDGLSVWLFGLSALLTLTAVLISWEAVSDRAASYYALLLVLETGMLGVFAAQDIILFYIFFEFTLIPLFFLIGVWGSDDRRRAAMKFFLFTFAGSVLTFLGLLLIVFWNYTHDADRVLTFSIPALTDGLAATPITPLALQVAVFLLLFAGFAIKVPLFPLHTWLPLAHVEAPAAGSVLLAGVLLKVGTYGFVRFNYSMLPAATAICAPVLLWLSVAGIVYGALVALAQSDIKRLIAYSSVSHLGFCMLGIFAANRLGLQGGVLQMISHGLSTGGLFALVGMLYERYHTRNIADLGGLARRLPLLATFMLVMTFSSIGLPGLNGFVGEFLLLLGMFQQAFGGQLEPALALQLQVISVLAVSGVVLGAWYMLWLVQRVFFGPLREPATHHGNGAAHGSGVDHAQHVRDLSAREVAALLPLTVFIVWIGVAPNVFVQRMSPALDPLADGVEQALRQRDGDSATELAETTSLEPSTAGTATAPSISQLLKDHGRAR